MISSSAQIENGSFVAPTSAAISTRLTIEEGNIDTLQGRNLIAGTGLGGGTLSSDRTFNVGEGSRYISDADAISTNDSEIVHDNLIPK